MPKPLRKPPFQYQDTRVHQRDDDADCDDQCVLHIPECDGYCNHIDHINQCLIWGTQTET